MIALLRDLSARTRVALGWWTLGILGMAVYVVLAFGTVSGLEALADLYKQYPASLRKLFGEVDITTLNGWIQVELVSYLPLLLAIYGGIYAASGVSREVEQRTVDFLLGLPVARWQFIGSRLLVGMWNLLVICVSVFVVLVIGVTAIGHSPPAGSIALALFNAYLLSAALLAAYVAVATFVDEQSRLTGITLGITFLLYVGNAALQATDAPAVVRWLTPFQHYHSAQAMSGDGLPVVPMVLLFVAMLAAGGFALYCFNRRDIAI